MTESDRKQESYSEDESLTPWPGMEQRFHNISTPQATFAFYPSFGLAIPLEILGGWHLLSCFGMSPLCISIFLFAFASAFASRSNVVANHDGHLQSSINGSTPRLQRLADSIRYRF